MLTLRPREQPNRQLARAYALAPCDAAGMDCTQRTITSSQAEFLLVDRQLEMAD